VSWKAEEGLFQKEESRLEDWFKQYRGKPWVRDWRCGSSCRALCKSEVLSSNPSPPPKKKKKKRKKTVIARVQVTTAKRCFDLSNCQIFIYICMYLTIILSKGKRKQTPSYYLSNRKKMFQKP
jgi:hypothetical protein